MFSTRTRASRAVAATLVLAGAAGLSACQDEGPTAAPPTSSAAAPSTPSMTQAPTSTQAPTTESPAPTTSESPTTSARPQSNAKLTAPGTTLKIGQEGIINDGSRTTPEPIGVTPTALEVAPDSVYTEKNLNKANGTIYYLRFDMRNVNTSGTISGTEVNGLFLHPKIDASNRGKAKRLYGSTTACDSKSDPVAAGQKASQCYIYQIGGNPVTDVEYASYTAGSITWTK